MLLMYRWTFFYQFDRLYDDVNDECVLLRFMRFILFLKREREREWGRGWEKEPKNPCLLQSFSVVCTAVGYTFCAFFFLSSFLSIPMALIRCHNRKLSPSIPLLLSPIILLFSTPLARQCDPADDYDDGKTARFSFTKPIRIKES